VLIGAIERSVSSLTRRVEPSAESWTSVISLATPGADTKTALLELAKELNASMTEW